VEYIDKLKIMPVLVTQFICHAVVCTRTKLI